MSSFDPSNRNQATSTGLDEKVASLLCYVLGFVTGIVFLIVEKKSRLVRFHAMQSTIVFGGLLLVNFVLSLLPFLGWLISLVLGPLTLILWLVLMLKAYQGSWFKLPYIGDIAERQIDQIKM
ncbi:hypothetical protein DUZ99_19175 [Xylanibacillus composti]|uniref:Membrane protein n=1 Tax=Xylanibacillus composti TaxID=1572762 RepID=A0A8J4M296_9BACL|nr:DUF4870 domain-containing protein [Xylanibacillus composti]MDT9727089.1 hypothetical protein [Xylanibacillus composti]GIQ68900.1 membrane protein [Xylanibacillus composti]